MRLPNGYGTVYKLSGNRRRPFVAAVPVGFKENGKVDQKTIGYFAKKPEALQALAEYNEKKKGISASADFKEFKRVQQAKQYTFTDVYNMWAQQRYLDKDKKFRTLMLRHLIGAVPFTLCRSKILNKYTCRAL